MASNATALDAFEPPNPAATNLFIKSIHQQLTEGYGFVPFIGAGFSAPSGSPLVWDLNPYLQRCIWLALGAKSLQFRPWNPRTDQWPAFNDHANGNNYWIEVQYAYQNATGSYKNVLGTALGDMTEWRDSLTFLSRIVASPPESPRDEWVVSLDSPNPQVKEDCIRHVLSDKFPTLGHRMLARLAPSLRLNTLLTTNFDDLLEHAFTDAKNPLEKVSVGADEPLPAYSSISRTRYVIKMHGDTHSLRLDYSLDALPNEMDRSVFVDYLSCPSTIHKTDSRLRLKTSDQKPHNHLLVMGVSAADKRTTDFVSNAFHDLDDHFRVFWLCHSSQDERKVESLRRQINKRLGENRSVDDRLICLRNPHLGLFYLQLFQTIRSTLPTAGVVFPAVSRLALPPSFIPKLEVKAFREEITQKVRTVQKSDTYHRCVIVSSKSNLPGVTTHASIAFSHIENDGDISLWLDMDDISSTEDLFEQLLDAACYRIGLEHWLPAHVSREPSAQARAIHDVLLKSNKKWVVFLNLREPPGSNLDDEKSESDEDKFPNGWADDTPTNATGFEDKTNNAYSLYEFIRQLTLPVKSDEIRGNITLVLLLRRSSSGAALLEQLITQRGGSAVVVESPDPINTESYKDDKIVLSCLQWVCTTQTHERLSFLLMLIFSQRIRYLSLIWSRPVWKNDANSWLETLEEFQLIRRKSGGFLWIHSRVRTRIRNVLRKKDQRDSFIQSVASLEKGTDITSIFNTIEQHFSPDMLADVHWHLAKWYKKVLASTSSPGAVFEAIHHACESAFALIADQKKVESKTASLVAERISWATSLLTSNSFLIQSQGYSRNSCRRLRHVRDSHCSRIKNVISQHKTPSVGKAIKANVITLQIRCYEIMRAIAREVGEDFRAYVRHGNVRGLLKSKLSFHEPHQHSHKSPHALEVPRWWRWSGMLAIASRSYKGGQSALLRALRSIAFIGQIPSSNLTMNELVKEIAEECLNGGRLSDRSFLRVRVEAARIIEVYVQGELLLANLTYRLNQKATFHTAPLSALIDNGLLISDTLYRDHQSDSNYNSRAAWLESRFLMHQAILSIYYGDSSKAAGILADAESTLRGIVVQRGSIYAVVELHRAEILLKEADKEWVTITIEDKSKLSQKPGILISSLSQEWLKEYNHRRNNFGDTHFSFTCTETKIRSHVKDATAYIKRAEPILTIRRRSVWWTTWYIQRHLRIVSLSIWTSVLEESETIPFLGPESALPDRKTQPEQLLFDAINIIRVDAYRLATILHEFVECCIAYLARLAKLDRNKPEWVSHRCVELGESLSVAINALNEVWLKRQKESSGELVTEEPDIKLKKAREAIHPGAKKYINRSLAHAEDILGLLNNPNR